jgi:hypothetical protein
VAKYTYPRQAYELTTNYNVRKVTLARPYSESSDAWGAYSAKNKFYRASDLFDTKTAAIKAGRAKIKRIQKRLDQAGEALKKHAAALDKADGNSNQSGSGGGE